MIYIYHIN